MVIVAADQVLDQICFDFLTFGSNDCVRGAFSGELKDLTPN